MRKKILVFGIASLLAVLLTLNIKAATYSYYSDLEVPLYQIEKGVILNKYDDNGQRVKNTGALFSRGFEAKASANDFLGYPCTTIYRTLSRNTVKSFGDGVDETCAQYANSNNNAMLTIRTTTSHNNSSYFNGWWTTTTANCGTLGC